MYIPCKSEYYYWGPYYLLFTFTLYSNWLFAPKNNKKMNKSIKNSDNILYQPCLVNAMKERPF